MTAEVAILNKSAVALAADSAMTLGSTGKIYPTNKLFTLSKYHPVGIMVYNNAEFMGVPWETLIKTYREEVGRAHKSTIHEYVKDFFQFLMKPNVCNDRERERNLLRIASDLHEQVKAHAVSDLQTVLQSKKRYSTRDVQAALKAAVEGCIAYLEGLEETESVKEVNVRRLLTTNRDLIFRCAEQVFDGFPISQGFQRSLRRALEASIKCTGFSNGSSGIVIAGFGTDEMFPTIIEVVTDGLVGDKLKFEVPRHQNIGRDGVNASIMPFAQSEMVHRFMEGVDSDFMEYLQISAEELLYRFGREVFEAHASTTPARRRRILKGIRSAAKSQITDFGNEAKKFRQHRFVSPVIEIVVHLPKEELASMAEALVNLTSLKRRVSAEQETVGGPIDVAVISKGDGFVWIKRKHYFQPELNQSFFHNYFYKIDHPQESS